MMESNRIRYRGRSYRCGCVGDAGHGGGRDPAGRSK